MRCNHCKRRDGSNVSALGLAAGFFELETNSVALANQWLPVGSPYSDCFGVSTECIGEADVFDVSRFVQ